MKNSVDKSFLHLLAAIALFLGRFIIVREGHILLLFVFVHQLVIGVVNDAVVAGKGLRVSLTNEALLDLFLHMLWIRQDVEAPIAS